MLGGWGQETQAASPAPPLIHCDLGPAAPRSGPPGLPSREKGLSEPLLEKGQSFGRPQRERHTQHGVAHRETPILGEVGGDVGRGPGGRGCPAGEELGQNRPLACSRIRVSYGLRSPRLPRVTGALSSDGPGMRDGGTGRGQQLLCSQVAWAWPHLHHWLLK